MPAKYQQLVKDKDYVEAAKLVSNAMNQLVREDVLAVGTALVDLIQAIIDAKFVRSSLGTRATLTYVSRKELLRTDARGAA